MVKYVKSLYWVALIVYSAGSIGFPLLYFRSGNLINLAMGLMFAFMLVKEFREFRKYYPKHKSQ